MDAKILIFKSAHVKYWFY